MPTSYVVCATLYDVADVFNVEELWQRARRRQQGEFLMESLIGHPRTRRGRNRTETYFHHVRVRIPRNDYVHDQRLNAGADGQALIKDLIEVHIKKLGKYVPEGQAVRYRLEPDPNLAEKQVRFLFGPAIYLPSAQESPIYRLSRQPGEEKRELGVVYPHQRLALLNGDPDASTFPVPDWPFTGGESVLLVMEPDQTLTVCAEPDGSLTIRPEGERIFQISDSRASLDLRIEPGALQQAERLAEAMTWTPGQAPLSSKPCLRVAGIALPRLSLHARAGLQGWRLGFDRHGALVRCKHPDAVAWLRIDEADRLWGEAADDSTPLLPPTVWRPHADLALELGAAPARMSEHYGGWVRLPQPMPLPAPVGQWFCFGRGADAELAPNLLDDPEALLWREAQTVRPEQLMLSRRHLNLRLDENGWTVKLESATWPVYRLSQTGELDQVLDVADRGREFPVHQGELLVVGGYVLELR